MTKDLVIASMYEDVERVGLRAKRQNKMILVCDYGAHCVLRTLRVPHLFCENLVKPSMFPDLDSVAMQFAEQLEAVLSGPDVSSGIPSPGYYTGALRWPATFLFSNVVWYYVALSRAFRTLIPDTVECPGDDISQMSLDRFAYEGVMIGVTRALHRRFGYACVDRPTRSRARRIFPTAVPQLLSQEVLPSVLKVLSSLGSGRRTLRVLATVPPTCFGNALNLLTPVGFTFYWASAAAWKQVIRDRYFLAGLGRQHHFVDNLMLDRPVNRFRPGMSADELLRSVRGLTWPFIEQEVQEAVLSVILEYLVGVLLPQAITLRLRAQELVESVRPDVLVCANGVTPKERALILAAAERGCPSVVLQHGLPGHPSGFLPITADYFLAWGPADRKWLIEHGADPDRVIAIGAPRMEVQKVTGKRRKANGQIPIVVFATEHTDVGHGYPNLNIWPSQVESDLRLLLSLAAKLSFLLVLKLHPSDTFGVYFRREAERIAAEYRALVRVEHRRPFSDVLCDAGVLVAYPLSSTIIEAFQHSVPVLLLTHGDNGEADGLNVDMGGSAMTARQAQEVERKLDSLLRDPVVRIRLTTAAKCYMNANYQMDGGGSNRLASWIHDVVTMNGAGPRPRRT